MGTSRITCIAALIAIAGCAARPPVAPVRRTDLTLNVHQWTLGNGLRVVLVREPAAREVQVTMRYGVGAVNDPADQPGMAHLVEHLMFEQVLGSRSLMTRLQDAATFFNAFTSHDATTYLARAGVAHLDELLAIEAVRLGFRCTTIDDSAFARERAVVLNELRLRDHATELYGALNRGVYPAAHPYQRSVGGSEATVSTITRDQACGFADDHYAPDNAALVVSGPIEPAQLRDAVQKFLGKVARRNAVAGTLVPRAEPQAQQATSPAPLAQDALLIAWPLPADPAVRAKVRTVATAARDSINSAVAGRVAFLELGDDAAPVIAVLVLLTDDDTMADVSKRVKAAIAATPNEFTADGFPRLVDAVFNIRKQGAIHDLIDTLDDTSHRDTVLAAEVLAGRDPSNAIAEEIAGLRTLSRADAARIARDHLGVAHATFVELTASERVARRRGAAPERPVHDIGRRRDAPDPAEAARPLEDAPVAPTAAAAATTRRTLPNGLEVVFVPSAGTRAVEIRLVFRAGTADEPADKRGVALVAGNALEWNIRHLNDMVAFVEAGGTLSVDVDYDHTTFTARGLAMHLDYLLAGLRRRVRDGRYHRGAKAIVKALREATKATDDEGAITDAWRTAMFGDDHPYTRGGLVRHASAALTLDDVKAFRARHLTPANATLVIAGEVDPVLANKWIDYLFAGWEGRAAKRGDARAAVQPVSYALITDVDEIPLVIVLPATAGGRAEQLVAAQMLSDVAEDVRHQLGASYEVSGSLYEARLATRYVVEGTIDAARIADAIELLRTRIEALRADPDVAARAFVTARKRVARRLQATSTSSTTLAAGAAHELVLGRDPAGAQQIAREVHGLTIDRMAPALAELELAAAAMLMVGRTADLDRAFAVLGRTPTRVHLNPDNADAPSGTSTRPSTATADADDDDDDDADLRASDFADALTDPPPPSQLTFAATAGYALAASMGSRENVDVSGYAVSAGVAYRLTHTTAVGVRASLGSLDGTYDVGTRLFPDLRPIEVLPVAIGGYVLGTVRGRVFAGVFFTAHFARITDDGMAPAWQTGAGLGLEVGADAVRIAGNALGLFARVETQLGPDDIAPMFSLGLAYRR
jgi:predicted Zn-dependent peptidase